MQQRYYDPVIGRFYSNDPVGFTASNPMMFNRYAYANNNPYKYIDPDGRNPLNFSGDSVFNTMARDYISTTDNSIRVGHQQIQALGPVDPSGVALGTIGVLASVSAASTGVGAVPGAAGLFISLDGIRSSWTGKATITGMALSSTAKALGASEADSNMASKVGDFAQGTFSGGAKALMDTAKGAGGVAEAAGAVSQLKDTASLSGAMTFRVDGRLDSKELSKNLDKK